MIFYSYCVQILCLLLFTYSYYVNWKEGEKGILAIL